MKQTKESKCTSCAYQKQKANGNHSWKVKFENNDEGFINTKENVAPFTEGNVEKYNIEEISIPGKDGNPFKFFGISKFKEPFFKKDDSKERIRAYSLILAKEMVLNGLVALTDDDNAKGVIIESKMMIAANKLRDRMLEALDKKGKDNVFVIMNSMEVALEFAKLRKDANLLAEDFNKFIEI